MVWSRSGPVEMMSIGVSTTSSRRVEICLGIRWQRVIAGYAKGGFCSNPACLRRQVRNGQIHRYPRVAHRESCHPVCKPVHMRTVSKPSNTSSLVMHSPLMELMCMARRKETASYQPQRRGRPSGGTKLVTLLGNVRTHVIKQFGREWPRTNAGGVGFGDTEDVIKVARANTRTGTSTASGSAGGSHKRVSAVVNIQQGALCAFQHHVFACFTQFSQTVRNVE